MVEVGLSEDPEFEHPGRNRPSLASRVYFFESANLAFSERSTLSALQQLFSYYPQIVR